MLSPNRPSDSRFSKHYLVPALTILVIVAAVAWTVFNVWPKRTQPPAPPNDAIALQSIISDKVRPIEAQTVNVFYEPSEDGRTLAVNGRMPTPELLAQLKTVIDQASAEDPATPKVVVNFNVTVGR